MPKGFTEHEKQIINERLLEQGYKLFSAYGLKKTNVEELAEASGISKGAFYIFYESKEALFMDVAEQVEKRFRQEVLAVVELPGVTARARLFAVLHKAFNLFKTTPILQFFSRSDYELLFRRVSSEKFHEHLQSDRQFIDDLIIRCQNAGIPVQVNADQLSGLLYALFFSILHETDLGQDSFADTFDILLELVAAYCLGEVQLIAQGMSRMSPGIEPKGKL